MNKIGVIGHFGIGLNLANGQTIKTKIITEQLQEKYTGKVAIVDTHGSIKKIIHVILNVIKLLKNSDNIILMVTENGLKVIVPILTFFNKKYKKTLHYVVIGGWLESFLNYHKSLKNKLKKFNYIYVETKTMKKQLEKMNFNNIIVMPNCKKLNIITEEELNKKQIDEPLKVCTFSRVMKEKGIEDAVNAIININKKYNKTVYQLDIYGQVDINQTEWFNKLKEKFPEYINYCGIIDYDKTTKVLKDYFLLLFPTHFYTEGIPGTIIDGYAAGVPVIAAKWESFEDVVECTKTGLGYIFTETERLQEILEESFKKPQEILKMSNNCIYKAKDFTIDAVMKLLYERIK